MRRSRLIRVLRSAGFTTAAAAALAVLVLTLACADGDEAASSPVGSVEDEGAGTASNAPADAIADYITTTGLDGETFEFADPVDCASIEDAELNAGKVCLAFQKSEIGEAAAEIEAELLGSRVLWTLELKVQNGTWVVTEVTSSGSKPAALSLPLRTMEGTP